MEFNKGVEAGSSTSHDSSVESVKLSRIAPPSDRAPDLSTSERPKRTAEEVARVVEGIALPRGSTKGVDHVQPSEAHTWSVGVLPGRRPPPLPLPLPQQRPSSERTSSGKARETTDLPMSLQLRPKIFLGKHRVRSVTVLEGTALGTSKRARLEAEHEEQACASSSSTAVQGKEEPLVLLRGRLSGMRGTIQSMLEKNAPMAEIGEFVTSFVYSLLQEIGTRAIQQLAEQGKACPTPFAIVGMGSLARRDGAPYSDLDFAILVRDDTTEIREYFSDLATLMYKAVVQFGESSQNTRGFSFCPGGLNPPYMKREGYPEGSPHLLATPQTMAERALHADVPAYGPEPRVINPSIQQFGFIFGDQALLKQFLESKSTLYDKIPENGPRRMNRELKGLEILRRGEEWIEEIDELSREEGCIDIKEGIARPIQHTVLGLAVYYGISEPNIHRCLDMLAEKKFIAKPLAIGLKAAYDFGFMLRVKAQLLARSALEQISISQAPPRGYTLSADDKAALRESQTALLQLRDRYRKFIKSEGRQNFFRK